MTITPEAGAPRLSCPLCGCTEFQQETGRLDSEWGFTSHEVAMKICMNCRFVMQFYNDRSFFDPE